MNYYEKKNTKKIRLFDGKQNLSFHWCWMGTIKAPVLEAKLDITQLERLL